MVDALWLVLLHCLLWWLFCCLAVCFRIVGFRLVYGLTCFVFVVCLLFGILFGVGFCWFDNFGLGLVWLL